MNRKFDNITDDVDFTDCMEAMKKAFKEKLNNEINEFKKQIRNERKNFYRKSLNFDKKFEDFDREFESIKSLKETKKKKLNIDVQLHITIEEE